MFRLLAAEKGRLEVSSKTLRLKSDFKLLTLIKVGTFNFPQRGFKAGTFCNLLFDYLGRLATNPPTFRPRWIARPREGVTLGRHFRFDCLRPRKVAQKGFQAVFIENSHF